MFQDRPPPLGELKEAPEDSTSLAVVFMEVLLVVSREVVEVSRRGLEGYSEPPWEVETFLTYLGTASFIHGAWRRSAR